MDITITTADYRLSIDTDLCFVIVTHLATNTWRRSLDADMVRALSNVIPRLKPSDSKIAATLWHDLSPMTNHDHQPKPVVNPDITITMSYPPTAQHSQPVDRADRHRDFYPRRLKARSYECINYDSESEQVWKLHHWWRGPEHRETFNI